MTNQDSTLELSAFHGTGRDDAKQCWFTCEAIWFVKRVTNEASRIAQQETTFRDKAMTWYMKYKATASMGQVRSLIEIRRDLLTKFQKLKSES
jgi:hypothetical protein